MANYTLTRLSPSGLFNAARLQLIIYLHALKTKFEKSKPYYYVLNLLDTQNDTND